MTLYKVLSPAGQSIHGGNLQWSLPTRNGRKWMPGQWHEVEEPVEICRRGLHLTDNPWRQWIKWDSELYIAEGAGERITEGDKTAFQKARLLRPAPIPSWWTDAHEFVDSIKEVPFLKQDGKPLKRWRVFETRAASRDAAWDAAGYASRAAAEGAAKAASRDAAGYASRAAAEGAARGAARAAARDAAEGAARAAARDSAWDAAGHASRGAARDAAMAAAMAAAWDAALYVQCVYICEGTDLDPEHVEHARDRWGVWTKGYGLIGDVNGVLYVYERI